MDATRRTFVILLSMHRSGSSLTASILERLGMSLGPYDLVEASPSNPYGHFESVPFCSLEPEIHGSLPRIHGRYARDRGHPEDVLEHGARCNRARAIPEEFVREGRELVAGLANSGTVSGFKDPRTILAWPLWRRVLAGFPDLRVVPVALMRSPHPIAMSLCTRSQGDLRLLVVPRSDRGPLPSPSSHHPGMGRTGSDGPVRQRGFPERPGGSRPSVRTGRTPRPPAAISTKPVSIMVSRRSSMRPR